MTAHVVIEENLFNHLVIQQQNPGILWYGASARLIEHRRRATASDVNVEDLPHVGNGDVDPDVVFSMGLPHDQNGKVDRNAFNLFLKAIASRDVEDWKKIPMGSPNGLKLVSPAASHGMELYGPSTFSMAAPPPCKVNSVLFVAELMELYEAAMARDVPFADWQSDPTITDACKRLSTLAEYGGPKESGKVSPLTIFRANSKGDLVGPYISQFMMLPFTNASIPVPQRFNHPLPGTDRLKTSELTLLNRNGTIMEPPVELAFETRYMCTPRDLGWYVHRDISSAPYVNAMLVMATQLRVPLSKSSPYVNGTLPNQDPFIEGGLPEFMARVSEAAIVALRIAWYSKWLIHQRLRPEEAGFWLDKIHRQGFTDTNVEFHESMFTNETLQKYKEISEHLVLSCGASEGAPLHPAYPSYPLFCKHLFDAP